MANPTIINSDFNSALTSIKQRLEETRNSRNESNLNFDVDEYTASMVEDIKLMKSLTDQMRTLNKAKADSMQDILNVIAYVVSTSL